MSSSNTDDKSKKFIAIMKLILLVLILAGIPAFLYFKYGSDIFSADTAGRVIAYLRQNRSTAALIIIGIQILQVVICVLPGQPIQFASSYMFGVFFGFALSLAGAVAGTAISFYLAKLLGSDAMHIFFDEDKLDDYRQKMNSGRGLLIAFLIYLIPGVPKDLVSYAAGLSEVRFRPFLLVATIGRSPGMIGSLLLGHYYGKGNMKAMIIIAIVTAVILAVCLIFKDRLIARLDELEMKDAARQEKKNG